MEAPRRNLRGVETEVSTFYFTFGYSSHNHNNYVRVEAADKDAARRIMIDQRGLQCGVQYNEKDFLPQIDLYHLTEIPL